MGSVQQTTIRPEATTSGFVGLDRPEGGDGGLRERLLQQRTPLDRLPEEPSQVGRLLGQRTPLDRLRAPDDIAPERVLVIAAGDTLGEIAARFGTSVDTLAAANGIADPDRIFAGDTLTIPAARVAAGDAPGLPAGSAPPPVESVGDGAGDIALDGPGGVAAVREADGTVRADEAQVWAVVDALPADVRAASRDAAVHVARILAESREQGLTAEQTAYVFASATHESKMGIYMEEIASGAAYEGRTDLGNTEAGDGVRFKGRGYVQVTGRANYADWSERLGIDLVGNPELAEDPTIAARILVGGMRTGSFTGVGLDDFIGANGTDYVGARAIVNGSDRADDIAVLARGFERALASVPT